MLGCNVDGGVSPVVRKTKGIKEVVVRTGVGVVELTLDNPMAPNEYVVSGGVTEAGGGVVGFVKTLASNVAKIEVRTYSAGVAADLDFDVQAYRL